MGHWWRGGGGAKTKQIANFSLRCYGKYAVSLLHALWLGCAQARDGALGRSWRSSGCSRGVIVSCGAVEHK